MAGRRLSEADRKAIAEAVAKELLSQRDKARRALAEAAPERPLHECTNEELREYASVLLPLHVRFGGRR